MNTFHNFKSVRAFCLKKKKKKNQMGPEVSNTVNKVLVLLMCKNFKYGKWI